MSLISSHTMLCTNQISLRGKWPTDRYRTVLDIQLYVVNVTDVQLTI